MDELKDAFEKLTKLKETAEELNQLSKQPDMPDIIGCIADVTVQATATLTKLLKVQVDHEKRLRELENRK